MPVANVLAQYWAKLEATFDTPQAVAATDAVNLEELTLEPSMEWEEVVQHVGTASLQDEIAGVEGGSWSAVAWLQPGAVGNDYDPDIGPALLKPAMGSATVGSSTAVYEFDDSVALSTQLSRYIAGSGNDMLWEQGNGCWVESGTIDWSGTGIPKLTLSGGFARFEYLYGAPTVDGVHSSSVTTINVTTGMIDQIRSSGSLLVKFDAEDNSGSGYAVTAVDVDNEQLTISPGLAGGLSGGEKIIPLAPSQTLAATGILGGVSGDLQIDTVSHAMLDSKLDWTTGLKPITGEGTANRPSGIVLAEERKVSVSLSAAFRQEMAKHAGIGYRRTTATRGLVQRIGVATAGKRLTITTPAVRFGVAPVSLPNADFGQFALAGTCRQSSTAGDEMKLTFS